MKKKYTKIIVTVLFLVFFIGIGIITQSTQIGEKLAFNKCFLESCSTETNRYNMLIKLYSYQYIAVGIVLSGNSGIGAIMFTYLLHKGIEN